jgi:hypothetical protein
MSQVEIEARRVRQRGCSSPVMKRTRRNGKGKEGYIHVRVPVLGAERVSEAEVLIRAELVPYNGDPCMK